MIIMGKIKGSIGYWSTHAFSKRSCDTDIERFCGWNALSNLVESCKNSAQQLLVLSLFKTGGRISEVLSLDREMFDVQEKFVIVSGMPVLKVRRPMMRTFPIFRKERLTEELIDLLPHDGKLFTFKRCKAYKDIVSINQDWWPHKFRGERASQLVADYNFDTLKLMQFFEMQTPSTPTHYAKMSTKELQNAMMYGENLAR